MGNICPPNKNPGAANGRGTSYITNEPGYKVGALNNGTHIENSSYPIINLGIGSAANGNTNGFSNNSNASGLIPLNNASNSILNSKLLFKFQKLCICFFIYV
jgi:hypothetical protein